MTQTYESGYRSTLAAKLEPGAVTMTVATAPTVTAGRLFLRSGENKERISFTGNPTPGGSNVTLTGLTRTLSQTADPATAGTGLPWIAGTQVILVSMHDQLVDKKQDQTFTGSITTSGALTGADVRFTGTTTSGLRVKSLTTAQRTALTASNGDFVYDTDLGLFYQYKSGVWASVDTGSSTGQATETTAGTVEIATSSEFKSSTDTGGTGAILSVKPSDINKKDYISHADKYAGEDISQGEVVFIESLMGDFESDRLYQTETSDDDGQTYPGTTAASQNVYLGYRIQANDACLLKSITKNASTVGTGIKAYIRNDSNVLIASADFSGEVATFTTPIPLSGGVYYKVLITSTTSAWTTTEDGTPVAYPITKTNIKYISGQNDNTSSTNFAWAIDSVETLAFEKQDIGKIAGNTRVAFKIFGSGSSGSTVNLGLSVVGSPSVNVGLRIETDNSGEPSGTLADANSTGSVAPGSLTSYIVDTSVSLAGSITLTEGTPYRVVLFQGTYGSETVNASNYYNTCYSTQNTTTMFEKLYNGSIYGSTSNYFFYSSSDLFSSGILSLTDASYSYKIENFGISREAISEGSSGNITIAGIDNNQTSLSVGTTYYLSDTAGAISSGVGTNSKKVGKGISSTEIKIVDVDL